MMKIVGKCYLSVADVILQDIDVKFYNDTRKSHSQVDFLPANVY